MFLPPFVSQKIFSAQSNLENGKIRFPNSEKKIMINSIFKKHFQGVNIGFHPKTKDPRYGLRKAGYKTKWPVCKEKKKQKQLHSHLQLGSVSPERWFLTSNLSAWMAPTTALALERRGTFTVRCRGHCRMHHIQFRNRSGTMQSAPGRAVLCHNPDIMHVFCTASLLCPLWNLKARHCREKSYLVLR